MANIYKATGEPYFVAVGFDQHAGNLYLGRAQTAKLAVKAMKLTPKFGKHLELSEVARLCGAQVFVSASVVEILSRRPGDSEDVVQFI